MNPSTELTEAKAELYYTENLLEVWVAEYKLRYGELRDLLGKYVNASYSTYINGWLPSSPNCPDILTLVKEFGKAYCVEALDEETESWLKHLPVEVEGLRQEVSQLNKDRLNLQKKIERLEANPIPTQGA